LWSIQAIDPPPAPIDSVWSMVMPTIQRSMMGRNS